MTDAFFRNAVLERWAKGEAAIAVTLRQMRGPDAAYIAQACGFDAVVVDREHATYSDSETSAICLAARALGIAAFVRVTGIVGVAAALDGGASGVIVPHVDSADTARAVASAARFPPLGSRSLAAIGPAGAYRSEPAADIMRRQNASIIVVAMLESRASLAVAREIAATDGIDALVVGNSDLAVELGVVGQSGHPDVMAANKTAADACRAAGKVFTMLALGDDRQMQRDLLRLGATFILAGIDTIYLMQAARADAAVLRKLAAD
jgi:2-keto-3-deoxy-L-rhamnonate aldolase RhmA